MISILKSPFWRAFGIIGGMIIGSGIFTLPYAVSVSGFYASIVVAGVAFVAVLFIHLAYAEITANTYENHRLPGYARLYLGNVFGNFNKFSEVLSFNIALLIYGLLGGVFLSAIFGGEAFWWTLIFFGTSAFILFFQSIGRIGFLNFILTIPLVAAILIISALAFRNGGVGNITAFGSDPLFAFGFFMFALTGLSAIPDAKEIFPVADRSDSDGKSFSQEMKSFRRVIILSTIVPLILYIVFIFSTITAVDGSISEDALSSLGGILGQNVAILGAIVGFLAIFTSFLVLGYDLKKIYELDVRANAFLSWMLVAFVPTTIFLLGMEDFVKLISIVGGIFIALDGLFVVFILRKIREKNSSNYRFLMFGRFQQALLIFIFIASIIYEVAYQII